MAMTDSDPPDANGRSRLGRFFFSRRSERESDGEVPPGEGIARPSDMRLKIAEFETSTVSDAMIPRADIVALDVATTLSEALTLFANEAHSRLPVYRESLDDPIGFVHIKDVVSELAAASPGDSQPLERLRREMLYVPASMPLPDLLVKMQSTRIHIALVVDEYGGTDGLITLEDLVEEIVGDIEDEHDEEASKVVRRSRNVFEVDARMEIDDFEEETGLSLSLQDFEDEIDTLGGVAFALAGRIPLRGEVLRHPSGYDIEIIDGDSRRIRRLRLRPAPVPQPVSEDSK